MIGEHNSQKDRPFTLLSRSRSGRMYLPLLDVIYSVRVLFLRSFILG